MNKVTIYNKLRATLKNIHWDQLQDDVIDTFTQSITGVLTKEAKVCIPNKVIVINPHEPPMD